MDNLEEAIIASQIWACIVAAVGVSGNVLTIITFVWYTRRSRRRNGLRLRSLSKVSSVTTTPVIQLDGYTLLLLNLSVCDLLYCSINLPITAYTYSYAFSESEPTKNFCSGAALFRYMNALVEWMTLSLITVQRCVDLRRSRGRRFFKPKPTVIFIGIIWTVSTIPQLILLFIKGGAYGYDRKTFKCDINEHFARFIFFSLETSLPCVFMIVGCCSIIYQIWRNIRTLWKNGMSKERINERFRDMLRSVALILALQFLFLFCVIPIAVYNIVTLITDQVHVSLGIYIYMLYWIQYGINFLLYVGRNGKFRSAFKQLFFVVLFKKKKCGPGQDSSDSIHVELRKQRIRSVSHNASVSSLNSSTLTSVHLTKSSNVLEPVNSGFNGGIHTLSVCTLQSTVNSEFSEISTVTETTQVTRDSVSK